MRFTPTQLATMLRLQHEALVRLNARCFSEDHPFLQTAAARLLHSFSLRESERSHSQALQVVACQADLVEYWRFVLAHVLQAAGGNLTLAQSNLASLMAGGAEGRHRLAAVGATKPAPQAGLGIRFDGRHHDLDCLGLMDRLVLLAGLALAGRVESTLLHTLVRDTGLGWSNLFRVFVGNSVMVRLQASAAGDCSLPVWGNHSFHAVLMERCCHLCVHDHDFEAQLAGSLMHGWVEPALRERSA